MKKTIALFLTFIIVLSIGIFGYADDETENPVVIPSSDSADPSGETVPEEPSHDTEDNTDSDPESPDNSISDEEIQKIPVITKNPTDENVFTGDRAVFIARADNATSITWYLISPDGASIIPASAIPQLFPGISVSGTDSEKLVITGVTSKISGYKAYAKFGNEFGFVDSAAATVTVSAKPQPTPTPVPTPVPTTAIPSPAVNPTVTSAPISTPIPSSAVQPQSTPVVTPRPKYEEPVRESNRPVLGFGPILFMILSILIIIFASVILIMYIRGTIDLSWLENLLTRKKNHSNSAPPDSDELPEKFYDPEDYK